MFFMENKVQKENTKQQDNAMFFLSYVQSYATTEALCISQNISRVPGHVSFCVH